jgi:hypothetical protein
MAIFELIDGKKIGPKHLQGLTTLEKSIFPPQYSGNIDLVTRWHNTNADVFGILTHGPTAKVVGYYALMPVSPSHFQGIIAGKVNDVELLAAGPLPYKTVGTYKAYLSAIVVTREFQDSAAIAVLKTGMAEKIADLKKRGFIITKIAGETISGDGEKFANGIGAKKVGVNPDGNAIFVLDIKV